MTDIVSALTRDHREVEQLFAEFAVSSSPQAKQATLDRIRVALARHAAAEEEGDVLPALVASTSPQRLDRMGDLFDRIKPLLPTHPHPLVPGTATAQLLAGPLVGLADQVRDLIGSAGR